jgi:hypothetical protein
MANHEGGKERDSMRGNKVNDPLLKTIPTPNGRSLSMGNRLI